MDKLLFFYLFQAELEIEIMFHYCMIFNGRLKLNLSLDFWRKNPRNISEDKTRWTWWTPSICDALMRISSHGRASKRGRKTLCNVCVEAILGVLVIANRDRAVYVGRAHASTTHDDGETRVHAICIHDVSTCDYVNLSHGAFSATPRSFNSRNIYYTNDFFRKWRKIKPKFVSLCKTNFFLLRNNSWFAYIWLGLSNK